VGHPAIYFLDLVFLKFCFVLVNFRKMRNFFEVVVVLVVAVAQGEGLAEAAREYSSSAGDHQGVQRAAHDILHHFFAVQQRLVAEVDYGLAELRIAGHFTQSRELGEVLNQHRLVQVFIMALAQLTIHVEPEREHLVSIC
jgi:hypothetical protein